MIKILYLTPLLILISCTNVLSTARQANEKKMHSYVCTEFNSSYEECKVNANALCTNKANIVAYRKEVYADPGDGFYMPTKHHFTVECHG
jgi:hypothetical protein